MNETIMLTFRARRRHTRSAWGRRRTVVPRFVPQINVEPSETISESDVLREGDTLLCDHCAHEYAMGELFLTGDGSLCYGCKVLGESQIA
ncbi:hypothetical protein Wildcat_160 [Mycobacterium phage Wildcat]|uniref:Uncharacterized protein n=3 Tax=Mycobacterium virus Wildcat TaxID=1993859 RepID=Q19XS4_9CAUD|nr:hypothetical protein Wildcat_160 [Mycobacterium phage Wildcat]ABE67740.1 hypothetical protein Wildcat_160 [Mycobacterium phage Wildcat]AJD82208.1 hypothetical protein COSMO_161 [Mycobacterium phage Cosmo]QGJ90018.1 hypothetical protein PBI_MARYV_146 [Mycobacterium phage MaryV]